MKYEILKDGFYVNTIIAEEAFVISYCNKNGYTFSKLEETQDKKSEPEKTETELLGQQITDLQLEQIEQGQFATELQLQMMEANANV